MDDLSTELEQITGDFADASLDAQLRQLLAVNSVPPAAPSIATGSRSLGAQVSQPTGVANDPVAQSGFATLMDESINADQIVAHSIVVGLLAGSNGANLLDNPGFELDNAAIALGNTITGWTATAGITSIGTTTATKRSGSYALRLVSDGVAVRTINSGSVPVDPGTKYRLHSWICGKAGNNAGCQGVIRIRWHDANGTVLSTASSTITIGAGTTFIENIQTRTADANAVYGSVQLQFLVGGSTAGDEIYFDDIELYRMDADINHAAGQVMIDSSGLTVLNGQISIQDKFGAVGMDALGFGGSWLDFIRSGFMYNSQFAYGTGNFSAVTEVGGGAGAANYLASLSTDVPYWVCKAKAAGGGGKIEATVVGTYGFVLRLQGNNTEVTSFYQDVPATRKQGEYAVNMYVPAGTGAGTLKLWASYRDSDHQLLGSRTNIMSSTTLASTVFNEMISIGVPPATAVFVRIEIEFTSAAAGAFRRISDIAVSVLGTTYIAQQLLVQVGSDAVSPVNPIISVGSPAPLIGGSITITAPAAAGSPALTLAENGGSAVAFIPQVDQRIEVDQVLYENSVVTPSNISGNLNDYNPSGGSHARLWRLNATTSTRKITGIGFTTAQRAGHRITLRNISTSIAILLTHEDAGSAAANRFKHPNKLDYWLFPQHNVDIVYDGTDSRWAIMAPPAPTGRYPSAWPIGLPVSANSSAAVNLAIAAAGNATAIPFFITSAMLVGLCRIWSTDAASLRSAEWRLYYDPSDGSNTLQEVPFLNGTWSFTPVAASIRDSNASQAVSIPPGLYWLVIRNTSGAQTFGIGSLGGGQLAPSVTRDSNANQAALGATIDISAWTGKAPQKMAILQGRIGNEGAVF